MNKANHFKLSKSDKKWWKEFSETLKKEQAQPKEKFARRPLSEINCTQEDIGQPHYSPKKGKNC